MAKKEKLMTEKELQNFMDMEIPPKRGTSAYEARQDAIREAKEAQQDAAMNKGYESTSKKKGGAVKSKSKSSASKRADGCAQRGKTRGKMC
jgi:hypothetical protein